MTSITTDPQLADKSDVRRELPGRLERVLRPLEDEIRDGDLTELMADALAEEPRDAEPAVRDLVFGKLRHLLGKSFERLDDHGRSVEVDGVLFHRAEPTVGRAMTVFRPVEYRRSCARPPKTGLSSFVRQPYSSAVFAAVPRPCGRSDSRKGKTGAQDEMQSEFKSSFVRQSANPRRFSALVLNADYRPLSYFPLSLWPWQESVKAAFLDRVEVVSEYDAVVRSPSVEVRLPSVVALRSFVKPAKRPHLPVSTSF